MTTITKTKRVLIAKYQMIHKDMLSCDITQQYINKCAFNHFLYKMNRGKMNYKNAKNLWDKVA